jgi:ketosteroid isomerase-like protein
MNDLRVSMSESHAFCHALSHIKGTRMNGEKADYWVRVTTCFQIANGQWLVGHEHVSMPATM